MVPRPHGGRLVNRVLEGRRRELFLSEAKELPRLEVNIERAIDAEDLAKGVFSPLDGFMGREDYLSVLEEMRLQNGLPWTIPIILDAGRDELTGVREGDDILLSYGGIPIAVLTVEEIYSWDKKLHAQRVFKTTDPNHPGVEATYARKELLVGGRIELINPPPNPLERYTLWPIETRVLFKEKGWRSIVAFQTRNVPHMGHEYVQKAALTFADGILIHPLSGWKKRGDYRDEVIIAAYEALARHYYPEGVIVLSVLRMNMNYAGPREAIHHAIVRKNFGATHFIVGRDHAGVGDYYGPYEAWEIFKEFPDLGITPLFVREAYYCKKCGGMVNEKICPHSGEHRVKISGTRIREMLKRGELPPPHMMRPEVSKVILEFDNPFVE
ncbi:MAG: sulfate adenylyltransferase [Aeropyrum sp.]|nr:sulfate adenylyltransferase [Aeropyrum sp.]MCE4615523.1 sulfate adenylyltransferase [Aeropyrum sp.]